MIRKDCYVVYVSKDDLSDAVIKYPVKYLKEDGSLLDWGYTQYADINGKWEYLTDYADVLKWIDARVNYKNCKVLITKVVDVQELSMKSVVQ